MDQPTASRDLVKLSTRVVPPLFESLRKDPAMGVVPVAVFVSGAIWTYAARRAAR